MTHYMGEYEENRYGNGGCGPVLIACAVLLFLILGCRTPKTAETEKVDSVRVEYKEKVVKVPVTVYVEVPAESKEKETSDTTSTLETSFATSTASIIWRGVEPFLYHSLSNKPQRVEKNDSVTVVEKEKVIRRVVRNTTVKTVYKEWEPEWWQTALMYIGACSFVIVIIFIVFKIKLMG